MITVNVLYFGAVREACKVAHEKISLESGTTVDGLVDQLQIDYPPLADFRKRVRMAVNESIAPASTILDDGDNGGVHTAGCRGLRCLLPAHR